MGRPDGRTWAPGISASRAQLATCAALLGLAACGDSGPKPVVPLAPAAPPLSAEAATARSLDCTLARLEETPIFVEPAPISRGWRLSLKVYTSPPTGWIDKGDIVHDGQRLAYLPDGSTRGLEDEEVRAALAPILEECWDSLQG